MLNKNKLLNLKFVRLMVIINSAIFTKTTFFILIKDLKKANIYISNFDNLKAKFNKISVLDIDNIIFKSFYHNLNSKSNFSNFDTNIFSR